MIISPTHRLLAGIALWTLASALAVALPVLWPAVVLAGVGLVGVVLGDAWPLVRSPPALLARRAPERLAVGRKAEVELSLHNPSSAPLFADVFDELPRDLVQTDPAFPRVRVPAGSRHMLRYEVVPQVRGDRVLGPALALVHSPLGLLRRRIVAGAGQKLAVYPDTSRFMRPEALDPKRVFASLGVKRARQRGEGMDFESLREYVPGDDPRRIDWPATARRGRLVTRLYQHEHNHSVTIAVDASRLMGGRFRGRTKLDYAVDSALRPAPAARPRGRYSTRRCCG